MIIKKGLKFKMSQIMSDKDNYEYEGYISRVYKNKCILRIIKSNCKLIGKGSTCSFWIKGLQNRIDNKDNITILNKE